MQSNPIPGMNWRNSWVTQSTHIAFYIPRKEHKALPERKVLQRQCHKLPWDCQGPRGHPLQNTIWQTPEVMWDFLLASSVFFASHPKHFRPCSAEVATENSCDVLGPYCDFLYLTACFQGKGWLKNMGHWNNRMGMFTCKLSCLQQKRAAPQHQKSWWCPLQQHISHGCCTLGRGWVDFNRQDMLMGKIIPD